ncbi:hypothetical protein [Saccharothrix stipae]
MTATSVNGVNVVMDEPTRSPISDRSGREVVWTQTRTLTLADGTIVYGCAHCDYTSPNRNSIRPHLQKHNAGKNPKPPKPLLVSGDLSLNTMLEKLADADRAIAERDGWKRRALAAERKLSNLRSALGVSA